MAVVVTNVGKGVIAQRMFGSTPSQAEPKYVGWGTGAGTAAVTDTTLSTEAGEARVSGTGSAVTTTNSNDTHQVVGTVTSASGQTITNSGVFDASTVGNLYVHANFTGIPLSTGDSIQFTFKVQFT